MIPPGMQGGYHRFRARCIAQRDGNVSQPTFMTDAANSAALGAFQKLFLAPGEQPDKGIRIQPFSG